MVDNVKKRKKINKQNTSHFYLTTINSATTTRFHYIIASKNLYNQYISFSR